MDVCLAKCYRDLTEGVSDYKSDWHQFALSTTFGGVPSSRMVVLREFNSERRSIIFHTDARSEKVNALKETKCAELLFYSKAHKRQYRFKAVVHCHSGDRLASYAYQTLSEKQRALYANSLRPGTPVSPNTELTLDDPESNFLVVVCNYNALDYLDISEATPTRLCFSWDKSSVLKKITLTP